MAQVQGKAFCFLLEVTMRTSLRICSMFFIFATIVCVGLELMSAFDNRTKHLAEMELLREQKQTSLIERYRYEKQIELLEKELENERIRSQVYLKLK